jgi:hypothetical protein
MRTVALVSCVKSKRPQASRAEHLYTSALFQKARSYATQHSDLWFILSARHGLVDPQQIIEPYEQTLNNASPAARREWARHVHTQMGDAGLLTPETRFLWLAGRKYKQYLADLLGEHEQFDPLEGLGIGQRLSWLTTNG